ncbi:endonuclease/exonuclease/phosphatase family protein [Mucilaginibacter pallidiroseus]|uniref:Endonuclease/exonuclease/phosphatase family protein n=1 Tax=Mucilaginibacter pallidiroseus TaxID=2599295 RepID=A0A563UGC7_9SPHI|nr:endonuclease/exonuclease/phosphatase family protein [Mucilaginibacter pallidiroseus]TWR30432.1 endonuclease/exonuclease/phosphatase family protein [Mucilaginibacter pallidiroseus]
MKVNNKRLPLIDKIFLFFTCALGLGLLLSYLAPVVDPAKFWLFAFFGLAFPILLVANLVMVAYWLIRQRWHVLLPVICILAGWNVLLNNVGIRPPSGASYPPEVNMVSLMTYNVHNFKPWGYDNDPNTKHQFLKLIEEQQPGVFCAQEFYTKTRGQYDMIDSIKAVLHADDYYYEPFESVEGESAGMAIFSKYPIVAHGMVQLNKLSSGNQSIYADIKKDGKIFRIYNVHLQSVGFKPPNYAYLEGVTKHFKVNYTGTKDVFIKLRKAFIKRSAQVKIVKAHAAKCPYPYIFCGDFNDTPASFAVNYMSKGMKNAFREKGGGLSRTYNGAFPNYQIDFVMASQQINVGSYQVLVRKLSDHFPVVTELLLNPSK